MRRREITEKFVKTPEHRFREFRRKVMENMDKIIDWTPPWRKEKDPFKVLAAEMMLWLTNRKQAEKIYREFVKRYSGPCDVAKDKTENVEALLRPLGLRWRARKIAEAMKEICRKHGNTVPCSYEKLKEIPGIGLYTAAAVTVMACGERRAMVDNSTARVLLRYFIGTDDRNALYIRQSRKFIEAVEEKVIPEKKVKEFSLALIDLAAKICTSPKPKCDRCFLSETCEYRRKSMAHAED